MRTDAGAVAATRATSQRLAREMVPQLYAGVWIFCQSRGCRQNDWWFGRAIAVDDDGFDGKCFRKFRQKTVLNSMKFNSDDYGITVQWYERSVSDPAQLEFAMGDPEICLVNANELRHWLPYADVELIGGPAVAVYRKQRNHSRAALAANAARAQQIEEEIEWKRTYRVCSETAQHVVDASW